MNYFSRQITNQDVHIFAETTTEYLIVEKTFPGIQRLVRQEGWFVILLHYSSIA